MKSVLLVTAFLFPPPSYLKYRLLVNTNKTKFSLLDLSHKLFLTPVLKRAMPTHYYAILRP